MPLDNLRNKIAALRSIDWAAEAANIVEQNGDIIADFQAEQLAKGVNRKGEEILPVYSEFTIEQKKKKTGLAGIYGHVTFYNTGEMYRSLFTKVEGFKFSIQSESFKFDKMVKRSGQNVVGLDLEMRQRFVEEITKPAIEKIFVEKLGFTKV